ncbi:MAG: carbohydrate ABC transporter permease [Oscillospiraceae bacterium]|nr:carbohydrate ABC transporter permease [Oscillospiraceae bacterium]
MMNNKLVKRSFGSWLFDIGNILFMVLIMFIMLYPFWNTMVVSFNDARDSIRGGLYFWPRIITINNYAIIFNNETLFTAFGVSVARTVLTTIFNVLFSAMFAYVLSRKEFMFNKFLTVYMVLTMYISAGLIPQYFLYKDLKLINNFWVYVLPSLYGAFNVIVIRTYMNTLPDSLAESAKIDGANEMTIFFRILLPLCTPVLATVALWVAVGSWNSWFDTFIFAPARQNLSTLQYEMMKILSSSMVQGSTQPDYLSMQQQGSSNMVTPNSLRAAMTVVTAMPILIVYPFMQKYFVQGLHIGSVKG